MMPLPWISTGVCVCDVVCGLHGVLYAVCIYTPVHTHTQKKTHTQKHTRPRQFMVGDAILVTPVLAAGQDTVQGYFPPGQWHLLWEGPVEPQGPQQGPSHVTLTAPLGEVPVHVAAGHVVPMQVC